MYFNFKSFNYIYRPLLAVLSLCLCNATTLAQTTYRYTAITQELMSERQGMVRVGPLVWQCNGNTCVVTGPWPAPSISACGALAHEVGRLIKYGRNGALLNAAEMASCNMQAITKVSKKSTTNTNPSIVPLGGSVPRTVSSDTLNKLTPNTKNKPVIANQSLTGPQKQSFNTIKGAPRIEAVHLVRPACSPPEVGAEVVTGRFVRDPTSQPFSTIEARAINADGNMNSVTVIINNETSTSLDFHIQDHYFQNGLPVAYSVFMTLPSGVNPNARLPVQYRWNPILTRLGGNEPSLRRLASGEIEVVLPELRFNQGWIPDITLHRTGYSEVVRSANYDWRSNTDETVFIKRVVPVVKFRVPSSWGSSDPSTWDGQVDFRLSAAATECTGGRVPAAPLLSMRYSHTVVTDTGRYYRLHCNCNHYNASHTEQEFADVQAKVCNVGGAGMDVRCAQIGSDLNGVRPPGPWSCLVSSSELHSDSTACNPIPENLTIEESHILP